MDHPPTCYEYPWPSDRCHRNWVKNITKLTSNINWSRRLPYPSRHSQILCQVNPPQRPYNKHHNRPLWLKPRLPLFQDPVCMTTDWSFLPHTHTHPPPLPQYYSSTPQHKYIYAVGPTLPDLVQNWNSIVRTYPHLKPRQAHDSATATATHLHYNAVNPPSCHTHWSWSLAVGTTRNLLRVCFERTKQASSTRPGAQLAGWQQNKRWWSCT